MGKISGYKNQLKFEEEIALFYITYGSNNVLFIRLPSNLL